MSFLNPVSSFTILCLFISTIIQVTSPFSYSYHINHGGHSRSSVSFSLGVIGPSRFTRHHGDLHPIIRTVHYSPPLEAPSRPTAPPPSPPLRRTYTKNRYDRICERTDGLKGFYVGRMSKSSEHCYYLCSRGRNTRAYYYCCPGDYRMDYNLRLCELKPKTTTTTTTTPSPIYNHQIERDNSEWNSWYVAVPQRPAKPPTTTVTVEKPMGKCEPGVAYKAHPTSCDHYLQCVFNLYYIEMKCPMGLLWNDRRKYCDTKEYSTCKRKPKETMVGYSWGQRRIGKRRTTTSRPEIGFDDEPIESNRRPVVEPQPKAWSTPNRPQIRCQNRWQEAFYRRKYGIDCRTPPPPSAEAENEVLAPENSKTSKTFGQRKRRPFWQFGGGGNRFGTKWGKTKTNEDAKGSKRRPSTTTTTTAAPETEVPLTTEQKPTTPPPTTVQMTETPKEPEETEWTRIPTTITRTPTITTTTEVTTTSAPTVITRATTPFETTTTAKSTPPEVTTQTLPPTSEPVPETEQPSSTTTVPTTILTTTTVPSTTLPPTTTTAQPSTTLPPTRPPSVEDEDDEESDDHHLPETTARPTPPPTTTTPLPTIVTEPPRLPTHAPLVNQTNPTSTSTTSAPIETTTFSQIFEENARCLEPGQRFKDSNDCQCYFECQLNRQLTRNCCPEGLLFNQNEASPSEASDETSEESESESGACDLPDNVQCLTSIQ